MSCIKQHAYATKEASCSMGPDESVSEFIARAAQLHGPLSDVEIVRLRAIFQPADTKTIAAPASLPKAA